MADGPVRKLRERLDRERLQVEGLKTRGGKLVGTINDVICDLEDVEASLMDYVDDLSSCMEDLREADKVISSWPDELQGELFDKKTQSSKWWNP